jgi:signal transduction histidine kinase/ActR/RegA family two-component response regulator
MTADESELAALRAELEETSRGLLAVYAELSDKTDELDRARVAAERAGEARATFLANMSHEIRSPLSAVIGFTALLLETDLTAEQCEYAETVRAAGEHLRGVVDDVLDLSKIESGRLELEEIPFDLVTCVEDAATMVAAKAEEKGLALATLFGPGVPSTVVGDPVRIRQILVNLLSNAVKFTRDGEVAVEIDLAPPPDDGRHRLELRVRDTGIGIPPDALARVFAPFTQADPSTTRNFGGTGLGLSICRELAQRMGGGIDVTSTVGSGSTFTCTVVVGSAGPESVDDDPVRPLSGRRILIAHEHLLVFESIRQPITRWGGEVVGAATVEGTLVAAAAGPPVSLLILDDLSRVPDVPAADATAPVVAVVGLSHRQPSAVRHCVRTPIRRAALREAVLAALGLHPSDPSVSPVLDGVPGRPLRILVAEDDPVHQRAATLLLTRLGHRVDVVPDGIAAVDAMLSTDYDLVLMDLHMPRLDGIAATRRVRLHRPGDRPRIVALTAGATDTNRRACLHAGMNDFLAKPVEARDLARVITEFDAAPPPAPAVGAGAGAAS